MGHCDGRYLAFYNLNGWFEREMIDRWALMVTLLVPPAFLLPARDIDNHLTPGHVISPQTGDGDVMSEYVTPFCYVCDSLLDADCRESQEWMPRRRNGVRRKVMWTGQGDDDDGRLAFDWKEVYIRLEKFKQRCPSNDGCTTHIYLNSDRVIRRCFDPKEPPCSGYEWMVNRRNPKKRSKVKVLSRLTCADWPFCNVDSAYYWPNGSVEALLSPHDDPQLKVRSAKRFCYECDSLLQPDCTGQKFVKAVRRANDVVAHAVDWVGLRKSMEKFRTRCPVESGCFFQGDHMTSRVMRGCRNMTSDLPRHLVVKDRRQESSVMRTEEVCRESECNSRVLFFSHSGAFLDSDWHFNNSSAARADGQDQAIKEVWQYQGDGPALFLPHVRQAEEGKGRLQKRTIGDMEREERRAQEARHRRGQPRADGKGTAGTRASSLATDPARRRLL